MIYIIHVEEIDMNDINELESGKNIEFKNIKKNFEYIKKLGAGGTGDTHLLRDNTTNMEFAFKKYVPKDKTRIDELYERFVDEIKILFKISHPNIVRVYNYYLFPERKIGYLQMEFVDGTPIDKYDSVLYDEWNNIFLQVINAFRYLEDKKILHRDIRPANILINKSGEAKVIDFGFGKIINDDVNDPNSVYLNWPVSKKPEEVMLKREYSHHTEIYFVGKLFEHLLKDKSIGPEYFNYYNIIDRMTEYSPKDRYTSFNDVYNDISKGIFSVLDFSEDEKAIYRKFSDSLYCKISEFSSEYEPVDNIEKTIEGLANVLRKNSLELYIQNNAELIRCFLNNGYRYNNRKDIEKIVVEDFYRWLISLSKEKQVNVIENINTKFSDIKVKNEYDDLPF